VTWFALGRAVERIGIGAFKVLVLAAVLYDWHKQTLAPWWGRIRCPVAPQPARKIVSYTLYLYCNFSGYTDIVIGVARFPRQFLAGKFRPAVFGAQFHGFLGALAHDPIQLAKDLRLQSAD